MVSPEWSPELGTSPEGYKYRGRFHIPTSTIYVDKSLEKESKGSPIKRLVSSDKNIPYARKRGFFAC
jgi:hypothetical protein